MQNLFRYLNRLNVSLGVLVTVGLLVKLGFNLSDEIQTSLFFGTLGITFIFVSQEISRFFFYQVKTVYFKERWFDFGLMLGCVYLVLSFLGITVSELTQLQLNTGLSLLILAGLFTSLVNRVEMGISQSQLQLRPAQLFLLSFFVPIVIGAVLLKMPNSTLFDLSWVDAFFMATSAVCVTGLTSVDLTQFSFLGQAIMLVLIQIGGLGIMTLTLAFASLVSGGLGVKERIMVCKLFSEGKISEVKGLLYRICLYTFSIEAVGAAILYSSFADISKSDQIWQSVFHSVSAFCNAGFSILDQGLGHEWVRTNYLFCSVIMILIILGGIGFPTLSNLQSYLLRFYRRDRDFHLVSVTTKVVLVSTAVLLVTGAVALFITDSVKGHWPQDFDSYFQSLFWSVTARTAGFNVLPVQDLSQIGVIVLIFLMWVGGAPMSTAGGIKVTTLYVAYLNLKSQIFSFDQMESFGRQIRSESAAKAFATISVSLGFIFISSFLLVALEPTKEALDILFEVVSAVSTVGLSRGITADLSDISKMVIIVLMFVGRIGLITVFSAFVKPAKAARYRYLEDEIII